MELTKEQRENMEHCLGLNYKKIPFRNYFMVYSEDDSWEELVKLDLATKRVQNWNGKKSIYYGVTLKGQKELGLRGECAETGCQNKYYKHHNISPTVSIPVCRKHYKMFT